MADLEIKRHLDTNDVADVETLIARVRAADGHQPIDEHRWVDAAHGGRAEFASLVLRQPGHDHLLAYAQVTRGTGSWAIDLLVDPHHRYDALTIAPRLLREALDTIAEAGGGHVHYWVYEPTEAHQLIAAKEGLTPGRELRQLRVPLPIDPAVARPAITTRPFVPGQDEAAWLEVNNAAFDWHPEQGGWTHADLFARQEEPWFDPTGFLMHEVDGRLAGFCWTKLHEVAPDAAMPAMGEIYVIAVHPDFVGRGLGRALCLAGLDHLSMSVDVGMLYVDADNAAALGLYADLGFTTHHIERAFVSNV